MSSIHPANDLMLQSKSDIEKDCDFVCKMGLLVEACFFQLGFTQQFYRSQRVYNLGLSEL